MNVLRTWLFCSSDVWLSFCQHSLLNHVRVFPITARYARALLKEIVGTFDCVPTHCPRKEWGPLIVIQLIAQGKSGDL